MSATADRSARAIQRSLFMALMLVQGFSAGIRARGREKARELREKPLLRAQIENLHRGGRLRNFLARSPRFEFFFAKLV